MAEKGAIAGDVLAQLNTAYNLPGDDPGRQAIPKVVFPEILRRAEAGDVFAQNELPDMYYYGIGTEKNVDKAVEWLEKAGANGFWRPLNKLGKCTTTARAFPLTRKRLPHILKRQRLSATAMQKPIWPCAAMRERKRI